MSLTHFHVTGTLAGYFTPLVVPGVSSRNFAHCWVRVVSSEILATILDIFSPHYKYQGIHLGFPDICHWSDGKTEWVMHGWVQQQT